MSLKFSRIHIRLIGTWDWKDIWRSTDLTLHWMVKSPPQCLWGVSRGCLNTSRTRNQIPIEFNGQLRSFPRSFLYCLQLWFHLCTLWPHRLCQMLLHTALQKRGPRVFSSAELSIILHLQKQSDRWHVVVFVVVLVFLRQIYLIHNFSKMISPPNNPNCAFFPTYIISNTESWS